MMSRPDQRSGLSRTILGMQRWGGGEEKGRRRTFCVAEEAFSNNRHCKPHRPATVKCRFHGHGGVSMTEGQEGQGARKGNEVPGHRLSSPPCFVLNLLMYFGFLSR